MNPLPISSPKSKPGWATLSVALASGFYISFLPALLLAQVQKHQVGQFLSRRKWSGGGLLGSVLGIVTYCWLPTIVAGSLLAIGLGILLAILVSQRAEKRLQSHDDSRIVIDEWIGAWLACWGLAQDSVVPLFGAFILFRLFDVFKGPWGRAIEKWPGGFGIVMDDVVAGVLANISIKLIILMV